MFVNERKIRNVKIDNKTIRIGDPDPKCNATVPLRIHEGVYTFYWYAGAALEPEEVEQTEEEYYQNKKHQKDYFRTAWHYVKYRERFIKNQCQMLKIAPKGRTIPVTGKHWKTVQDIDIQSGIAGLFLDPKIFSDEKYESFLAFTDGVLNEQKICFHELEGFWTKTEYEHCRVQIVQDYTDTILIAKAVLLTLY